MFFKKKYNNLMVLIALSGLYPAVFWVSSNWFTIQKHELLILIVSTPFFALFIGICFFAILYFSLKMINRFLSKNINLSADSKIWTILGTLYACFIMFFLLSASHEKIIKNDYLLYSLYGFIAIIFILIGCKTGVKAINYILILLITVAGIKGIVSYYSSYEAIMDTQWYSQNKKHNSKIRFKNKPNVYFIVLESYQDANTLKTIHNIDNSYVENEFRNRGFIVYENVFSNYYNTLLSLVSTFTMQHNYYKIATGKNDAIGAREIIGGKKYNAVIHVFKNNGYDIQYISYSDYCYLVGDPIDYVLPSRTIFKAFEIYQNITIDNILSSFFRSYMGKNKNKDRVHVEKEEAVRVFQNRVKIAANNATPHFTFFKSHIPGHYGKVWNEIEKDSLDYPERLKEATAQAINLVEFISIHDRNAMIIIMGDHGVWKYREIWNGEEKNINTNIRRHHVSPSTVSRDLYGTFLAIKWPGNIDPKYKIISHVNLFRYIFSFLSNNQSVLETKVKDESYFGKDLFVTVRDGVPLETWERLN